MSIDNPDDEIRRAMLVRALRLGAFGLGSVAFPALAQQSIPVPGPLPRGRSIYRMNGAVTVNGSTAGLDTFIRAGDEVRTGDRSMVTFVVDQDAFLLRGNSRLQLERAGSVVSVFRMLTGALLSVFGSRETRIATPLATIGIRGTGVYVESDPERSYVCTCYGEALLSSVDDPSSNESIVSQQHDAPRYILASGGSGERIRPAPFVNHTDEELAIIEGLVGRDTPFAVFGSGFDGSRGTY